MPKRNMKCPICQSYCNQTEDPWGDAGYDREDQNKPFNLSSSAKTFQGLQRSRECDFCGGHWHSIELSMEFVDGLVAFFKQHQNCAAEQRKLAEKERQLIDLSCSDYLEDPRLPDNVQHS